MWAVLKLLWQHHTLSNEVAQQGRPPAGQPQREQQQQQQQQQLAPKAPHPTVAWPKIIGAPGPVAEANSCHGPRAAARCPAADAAGGSWEEVDLGERVAGLAAQLPGPLLQQQQHRGGAGSARGGGRLAARAASYYAAAAANLYAGYLRPGGAAGHRAGPVAEASERGSGPGEGRPPAAARADVGATCQVTLTPVVPLGPAGAPAEQQGNAKGKGRQGGKKHVGFASQVVPLGPGGLEEPGGGEGGGEVGQQDGQLQLVALEIQERLGPVFLVRCCLPQ